MKRWAPLLCVALLCSGRAAGQMGMADSAYAAMRYDVAIAAYDSALAIAPDDATVLWHMARARIASGEIKQGEEKEAQYRAARDYAERCVRADSMNANGHAWLAAALGNIAFYEGSRTKVRLANDIHRELNVALRIDSTNDVAWSILGSFYRALGNVSWLERQLANIFLGGLPEGGYEEAEAALKRATTLAPTVIRHRFELALLYTDWDRPEFARAELERCLTLPVLVASDRRKLERVKEMLESQ